MDWLLHGLGSMLSTFATDVEHLFSPAWWRHHSVPLFNILMIDLTLAGDNAIVVGMAASRVEHSIRTKVIFWGIAGAVLLRIIFSSVAQQMSQIPGVALVDVYGQQKFAVRVQVDPVAAAARNISLDDIRRILVSTNSSSSSASSFSSFWWGFRWTPRACR